jgi:hypothetical protein
VKSLRRLGRVIGQCEALTPAPNVPEKNPTKALLRRMGFFGGQAATAAQRIAYVMCCFCTYEAPTGTRRVVGVLFFSTVNIIL